MHDSFIHTNRKGFAKDGRRVESNYHWSLNMNVVDEVASAGNCPADMPLRAS